MPPPLTAMSWEQYIELPGIPPVMPFHMPDGLTNIPQEAFNVHSPTNTTTFMDDLMTSDQMITSIVPKKRTKKVAPEPENPTTPPVMEQIISYPPLKLSKTNCKNFERVTKLQAEPFEFCTTDGLVGIEVEVENMSNQVHPECYWQVKTDGSLRNNGIELVSQPLTVSQIQYALEHLKEVLHANNNPDFSNRTSIHVHLNCRNLTQDQVWNLVILYCLFEKHFYKFVGSRRLNSIFCVPIYRSNILSSLNANIYSWNPIWHKYCGLNILPLQTNGTTGCYGTIEFRHLYGTDDPQVIMAWIDNILALRKLAMEMSKEELSNLIEDMNTTSSYKWLYNRLFKPKYHLLSSNRDFEDCVSHTKRELFGNTYRQQVNTTDLCIYWSLAHKLNVTG